MRPWMYRVVAQGSAWRLARGFNGRQAADGQGVRGPQDGRLRPVQRKDRGRAAPLGGDRQAPPGQRLRKDERRLPRRGHEQGLAEGWIDPWDLLPAEDSTDGRGTGTRYRCADEFCGCEMVVARPTSAASWRPPECHGREMTRVGPRTRRTTRTS
jgi:hypothetical protein